MTFLQSNQERRGAVVVFLLLVSLGVSFSEEATNSSGQSARKALERFNSLIGEWRGTGQVRRGSNRGAWRESGEFVWDFSGDEPAVKYLVKGGKHVDEGLITWNRQDHFHLALKIGDEQSRDYTGDWDKDKLILVSKPDEKQIQYRFTITPLNEKRTLVLHEKTSSGGESFFRVAEVGYTRAGTRLALPGGGRRECVVTGGTGQTAVSYNGETYYVCCSGCKQAFDDDPEGIIAEFKAKLKARLESVKK